jgi:antitoxin VapB
MASHAKKPSPKPKPASKPSDIGRVFMHGRSQAVQIPKAFRLPGGKVRIRRHGQGLLLEPVAPVLNAPRDWKAFWAELDRLGGGVPFLPEGRPEQPPMPDDPPVNPWDEMGR